MAVRPLVNIERLTTAHVNSVDGSMTYESGVAYNANTTVSYNGSLYTANVDIEDTDTDTPDEAPDRWSLTINASEAGTAGDISALAARVTTLEDTVGDDTDGLVKDVNGITDNLFENGSVNLCPEIITSQTVDTGGTDVTIVVNSDGTFTVDGTVTDQTIVNVTDVLVNFLKAGKRYKLSGSPSGSSESTYALYISGAGGGYDFGDGYEFTLEELADGARIRLVLFAATTLSDVVFKPMITLADVPDSDYAHYVPYAMSNRELTDETDDLSNKVNYFKFSGTIGFLHCDTITGAYEVNTTIPAIQDYIDTLSDYTIRLFAVINSSGQTQGAGLLYKYGSNYAGFFYSQIASEKLIMGRKDQGTWASRQI